MVCPRCIMAVRTILVSEGLVPLGIRLGEAEIDGQMTIEQRKRLSEALNKMGFELLDDPRAYLVEQLRIAVIEWVRMKGDRQKMSEYLAARLSKDYSTLSKLFSEVNGMTIERFTILHRIEYAKELLCYSQQSTSEIAYLLGYSSPAHLSTQFKQITGMSPKEFREQMHHNSISLSDI